MNTKTSIAVFALLGYFLTHSAHAAPIAPEQEQAAKVVKKAPKKSKIPALNTDPGLSIIDKNKNGVRDDIDAIIKLKLKDPIEIISATRYAKAAQMSVAENPPSEEHVKQTLAAIIQAIDCANEQMGEDAPVMISNIRTATSNTKDRHEAYVAMQEALVKNMDSIGPVPPLDCSKMP